jgi:ribosome-associated translation inhibitor RaiA
MISKVRTGDVFHPGLLKDLEMIAEIVKETNKPIHERLDKMETKVTEVQMTLENETNKEIHIIAEGHLDLSRKLDDALKVEAEKEMLLLRVNRLENEVRRIKQRIEEIA